MLTIALVVMVIFLFLRTLAATIIPSVAVPLSLVGTFGVMYLLGYSLNNLTLMALTISTGFVVDDAIVMIENIARYIEEGDDAARGGAQGLGADRLHDPLADRLADRRADPAALHGRHRRAGSSASSRSRSRVTILVSAVVSLTLTPMMCAKLLRHHAAGRAGPLLPRLRARLPDGHRLLRPDAARGPAAPDGDAAWSPSRTLVPTLLLYVVVPKGFFPVQDTGVILGISEAPQTVSFAAMAERQQALAARSWRTRPWRACRPSSASTAPTPRSTAAASRSTSSRSTSGRSSATDVIRRLQPRAGEGRGDHALHAAGAGPDGRGPRQPHAVPVQPGGPGRGGARRLGARSFVEQAPGAARAARRGERPAERRPRGPLVHRPRRPRRASASRRR